jgi:hypothetical protein
LISRRERRTAVEGSVVRAGSMREGDDVATTETLLCAKCGGPGDGWKCAICGSVAREHDAEHRHVGSDRYCTIRCAGCGQADVLCTCV